MRSHIIFGIALLACAAVYAQSWQLIWSDEFDYDGLPDPAKWGYEEGYIRNDEAQYYTRERLENARVENGNLVIDARRDFHDGHEYTSASVRTRGIASWTYGRIEVRAKLPTGVGMWPAIWTLGENISEVGWPTCGEIDLMENVGFDPDRIHGNIHTLSYHHSIGTNKGASILVSEPYNEYHVYAIEWFPDRIDHYFDDTTYFTFANEGTGVAEWPYDAPQYLILNTAIGGSWGGQQGIDTTIFPQLFYIDYVRVYQQSYTGPYTLTLTTSGDGNVTISPQLDEYDSGAVATLTPVPGDGSAFAGWAGDITGSDEPLTVTMTRNLDITARFSHPCEQVTNGSFTEGANGWEALSANNGAQASGGVVDGAYAVSVTQAGADWWDIQLRQAGIPLEQDTLYRFSFDAWAEQERPMTVGVNQNFDPWGPYFRQDITLTTTPQTFSFDFTMDQSSDTDARVEFNYGAAAIDATVDNVSIVCLSSSGTRQVPAGSMGGSDRMSLHQLLQSRHSVRVFDLRGREVPLVRLRHVTPGSMGIHVVSLGHETARKALVGF